MLTQHLLLSVTYWALGHALECTGQSPIGFPYTPVRDIRALWIRLISQDLEHSVGVKKPTVWAGRALSLTPGKPRVWQHQLGGGSAPPGFAAASGGSGAQKEAGT